MTIAISVKVHDGLVLAADSASTVMVAHAPGGEQAIVNVYYNADKIFNLLTGRPVGAITWGSGSVGFASVSALVKDLRERFMGLDPAHKAWAIDLDNYSIEQIARQTRKFLFEEQYQPFYQNMQDKPSMGF